jgi:ribosomal protein S27E
MPRADVEAAGALNCSCGSEDLEIREPGGKLLVHKSQVAKMQAAQSQAQVQGAPNPLAPEGLVYEITCLDCGNHVEVDGAAYDAAENVKCPCGSENLKVDRPPPSTAEMMMAVRQLSSRCPLCGNTGWVETDGGKLYPCRACQGV